jgi:hypothetical protein
VIQGRFAAPNFALPNFALPNLALPNLALPNLALPNRLAAYGCGFPRLRLSAYLRAVARLRDGL